MSKSNESYPASLHIDYEKKRNRLSVIFRLMYSVPILVIAGFLSSSSSTTYTTEAGTVVRETGGSIAGALFIVTALMILFRQKYPKWWFDFNLELNRFMTRVGAYLFLLTDKYPSTEDPQGVKLELTYPNVKKDLNRALPLFKWLFAIPHYVVLALLVFGAMWATIIAWFSILLTGKYPKGLFDYVVGVGRWAFRVNAYTTLLTTDEYPPFSLK